MWWLAFTDGGVVIMTAESLAQARLLAAAKGLGRASHFVEGRRIDTERLPPIPPQFVGRMLTPVDARQLLDILNRPGRGGSAQKKPHKQKSGAPKLSAAKQSASKRSEAKPAETEPIEPKQNEAKQNVQRPRGRS